MTEKLFPERKRCKTCRGGLSAIVLDGLYCSYKCATLPEPFKDIMKAPRGCRLERDGKWVWKQKYRYELEVPGRLRDDPSTNVYTCEHCHFLHVGHSRATGQETARLIGSAEVLGDTLRKIRESRKQTLKEVGAGIKERPIRIKEIEEGHDGISTKTLFKLISYYRVKINLLF